MTVTLVSTDTHVRREFSVEHAEVLMGMKDCCWEFPKDSEFELKDGSIVRRHTKGDKRAEKA